MKTTEVDHIKRCHAIAEEWFKNHVASNTAFAAGDTIGEVIEWRRPDTSNYHMQFTVFGQYVVVTGDVGDAIYAFGQHINFDKLMSFDWHYFSGKCVASETGRNYTQKIEGVRHQVPNVRVIGHFVGLQMALKLIKSRSKKEEL